MALSQIQCLDDNHVNPRTHESKPEFFYCEDQRLALEALLRDGREAFQKYLEARGLRGFLSDPELETLSGLVEPYDPGSELLQGDSQDERTPLSLHYWPDLSDTSIPQMDLGWPDCDAYRGVTRTTVYTQPPLDGQAHIKEVVRKMIAQAQKVIGVVMDVFTDVDIFRDLLDAGFKRRISVYILLERTTLPHFLSMCRRANMHGGHLKHLRVRCTEGSEFYTRSCMKVRGRMGHRFMFIDGDKAVSGSYSFTWMSSRLDRNLITVVTGQAVEGFDRLFRILYATSRSVDLRQAAVEPEPEVDPLPQTVTVAPPSAAVARKLYNPKYALVAGSNPSPTASVGRDKEPQTSDVRMKNRRGRAVQEAPPLHLGLMNLEKACLITYLPTWPEPDPPSDVIGFINIRDASKPTQVHLQRSEMFETSQAIRFSSPITKPQEELPEVAKPRQLTAKHEGAEPAKDQPEPEKEMTPQSDGKLETNMADKRDTRQHTPQHTTDTLSTGRDAPDRGQTSLMSDSVCRTHTSEPEDTQQGGPTNTSSTAERSKTPPLPLTSSSVVLSPPTSSPPVPKPRTVQLLIKDSGSGDGRTLPEICMVRKSEDCPGPTSAGKDDPNPEEMKTEDVDERQDGGAGTQSDVWVAQEMTPKGGDETSAACKTGGSSSVHRHSAASEETLTTTKTYLARAEAPQRISYSELTAQEVSEAASAHTPVSSPHHAVDLNSAPSKKSLCLHLSDTHLRTPARETQSLSCLARTPTPDGLPPRTPTPDSRTTTPDGYVSTREDSARSTTSEEYYECSDSPLHDSVFDHVDYRDIRAMEEHISAATAAKVRGEEEEEGKQSVRAAEEADTESPLRKNQSAGGTAGGPTNEGGETPPLSPIKGSEAPHGGVEALRPSGAETSRESEKTPLKLQRVQHQEAVGGGGVSSSRPLTSPRPLSASQAFGPRLWGKEGRTLSAGLQDNASSPRRPPSRLPPPAAGSIGSTGGGRKQAAQTAQSLPPRQPAAAQSKPSASFLHSSPQSQAVSGQEAPGKEEGRAPFGFTFSRLYSLKGLKDKMNKLPSQSRKSSGGSAGRKSTS